MSESRPKPRSPAAERLWDKFVADFIFNPKHPLRAPKKRQPKPRTTGASQHE